MEVDGKRLSVGPGATVVVPAGIPRGVEAETQLAFLGSHGAGMGKKDSRRPFIMFGLMAIFGLVVMVGLMMFGASPMAMMISSMGGLGSDVWGGMALPIVGLLGMFVMMFFMFRWMRGNSGMMAGMRGHSEMMAMKANNQTSNLPVREEFLSEVTYAIPSIGCGHCKETIERAVGAIDGVDSVRVEVENKSGIVRYNTPETRSDIETVLGEIGYPPVSQ